LGHEAVSFFPRIADEAPSGGTEVPIEWSANPRPLIGLSPFVPREFRELLRLLSCWERRVGEEHEKKPFDVCLALWALPAGLVARRIGRRLGLPYATWSLGSDINKYGGSLPTRGLVRSVLKDAAAVFANSQALSARIEELSGRRCDFLATSRPLAPPPADIRSLPGTTFLFIGRLEPVKGPDVLLEAAARVKDGAWRIVIAGDGSMRPSLGERVEADARLRSRVSFAGHLTGEVFLRHIYGCDCLVVPSRSESMPVVLSEGLQAGKPFIVTDVGDLGSFVSRFGLGEVVLPDSPAALAAAMERFLDRPARDFKVPEEALALLDVRQSARRFSEVAARVVREGVTTGPGEVDGR